MPTRTKKNWKADSRGRYPRELGYKRNEKGELVPHKFYLGEDLVGRLAQDVGELDDADAAADLAQILLHRLLRHGEGHAEQEGRGHDAHGTQERPGQELNLAAERAQAVIGIPQDIEVHQAEPAMAGIDQEDGTQRQQRHAGLLHHEHPARIADPADDPAAPDHARGVGDQEQGQHQGEGVGGRLHHGADQPEPDDLERDDEEAPRAHRTVRGRNRR